MNNNSQVVVGGEFMTAIRYFDTQPGSEMTEVISRLKDIVQGQARGAADGAGRRSFPADQLDVARQLREIDNIHSSTEARATVLWQTLPYLRITDLANGNAATEPIWKFLVQQTHKHYPHIITSEQLANYQNGRYPVSVGSRLVAQPRRHRPSLLTRVRMLFGAIGKFLIRRK